MRDFTLVQDISGTEAEYWHAFFDPTYERAIVEALAFKQYDILVHDDTPERLVRKTRATPRLDLTASLAKLFGASFGYVEEGTFDKQSRIWRTRTIPDAFSERMSCDMVMRVEPGATEATCRRRLEFHIEARVRAIGGLAESGFEKNLRAGWAQSAAFMNDWLRRGRAA
jgi:hypothetical protein